jgi:hypothetical protein
MLTDVLPEDAELHLKASICGGHNILRGNRAIVVVLWQREGGGGSRAWWVKLYANDAVGEWSRPERLKTGFEVGVQTSEI